MAKIILMRSLLFFLFLMLCGSLTARAQVSVPKVPVRINSEKPLKESGVPSEEPHASQQEMLTEMSLKREASQYKEHITRAKENAQLAVELCEAFLRQKTLGTPDLKKLSQMEKLARKIRNNAGGEENKEELKTPPQQIEEALELLAKLSVELQKKVESTPRQVVSTAVIQRANEVVELVKYIRTLYR